MAEEKGVWRTIRGRRVFIRDGEDLYTAMKNSGKFQNLGRSEFQMAKAEYENANATRKFIDYEGNDYTELENLREDYREKRKNFKELKSMYENNDKYTGDLSNFEGKHYDKENKSEYELYKKAKTNPDSIDPMTENSTDWEALDKKYASRYNDEIKKQVAINTAKKFGAKEVKVGGETIQLNNEDKKYEFKNAYQSYRDKRNTLEGRTKDELGNWNYDSERKDATWTGKEYTNDEFLENLEDENWHTERKMLLDAGLTESQMSFVKDNTTFRNGSPSLDREITEELIKGAKGEAYRKPEDIKQARKNLEVADLKKDLDIISKSGKYNDEGNYQEGVKHDYRSYYEKKQRYEELTGTKYDDSNITIPYDPNKTYEYSSGIKINQDLMKDRYSGKSLKDIRNDIEFNKKMLMDYSPKNREIHNAEIKEMEKYANSLPEYKSRISDDFGTKDWENGYSNQFGGNAWKGTKSDSGLHGKDKIKAIDDEIKKAYPGIKTSRSTGRGGYTDSFSYRIMESDEPIVRDISDFSETEIERLYNSGYNKNWYKTKEEYKDSLKRTLESGHFSINEYNLDDDERLTPYGKQVFKDIMKVSNAYNYDESDSMTDYFNTGHYLHLSVGKDGTPYKTTSKNETIKNFKRRKK